MELQNHPFADLFPLIDGAEFERFALDIKNNGLRDRIVLLDGKILDGRNRYRAALYHGLPGADGDAAWFRNFDPESDGEPLTWVLSKNLARRHLSESQRALAAERLATMRQGARTDLQPSANLQKVDVATAADLLHVSERLVGAARALRQHGAADLVRLVEQGRLSVSQGEQAARLGQADQARVVELVNGGAKSAYRTAIKIGARDARERELGKRQQALPAKKFGVILADPEWEFVSFGAITGQDRAPSNHYPTSSEQEIAARDVQQLAADDAMLAMWTTDLARGIRVMESWGFTFKSYFVWVKDIVALPIVAMPIGEMTPQHYRVVGPPGLGYWNRDRDEILLIGTRGNFVAPAHGTQPESVWFAARPRIEGARRGRHSAKPDNAHLWIEQNWPTLAKIELNARAARPGWDVWGLEAPAADDPQAEKPAADLSQQNQAPDENRRAGRIDAGAGNTLAVSDGDGFDLVRDLPAFLRRTAT